VRLAADGPDRWRIDRFGAMRVPGIVFATEALLPEMAEDQALAQVVNVASLPSIVEAS
jgi:tRNA-splicing ligase RtcB